MIDQSAEFLHVLAAIGIMGGGIVQVLAGVRLRAARTGHGIGQWASFARTAGLVIVVSAVVSLLTGGHLAASEPWTTEQISGFSRPFIVLGVAGLVLLAPIGPMLGGARLRRLVRAAESADDEPAPAQVLADARSPGLWGPIHSLVGVGVGFVALMVYKPGWIAGAVLLVATFAAGWVVGSLVAARQATS